MEKPTKATNSGVTRIFGARGAEEVKCAPSLESRHVSRTPTVDFYRQYCAQRKSAGI